MRDNAERTTRAITHAVTFDDNLIFWCAGTRYNQTLVAMWPDITHQMVTSFKKNRDSRGVHYYAVHRSLMNIKLGGRWIYDFNTSQSLV